MKVTVQGRIGGSKIMTKITLDKIEGVNNDLY